MLSSTMQASGALQGGPAWERRPAYVDRAVAGDQIWIVGRRKQRLTNANPRKRPAGQPVIGSCSVKPASSSELHNVIRKNSAS